MSNLPDDEEMEELRALVASNAEAVQKLRAMVERLGAILSALGPDPTAPEAQPSRDSASAGDPNSQTN